MPSLSFVYYSDAAGTNVIATPENVGTYYVRAFTAANAGNNAAQSAIAMFQITPATISSITGITANNKVFDGNTNATLVTNNAAFTGIFAGDSLTVASATGSFVDPNVGNGKTVNITGLTLGGADAANYSLASNTATTTANILSGSTVVNTQLFYRAIGTNAAIGNATNPTTRIDPSKLALQPGQTEASIEAAQVVPLTSSSITPASSLESTAW